MGVFTILPNVTNATNGANNNNNDQLAMPQMAWNVDAIPAGAPVSNGPIANHTPAAPAYVPLTTDQIANELDAKDAADARRFGNILNTLDLGMGPRVQRPGTCNRSPQCASTRSVYDDQLHQLVCEQCGSRWILSVTKRRLIARLQREEQR